MFSLWILLTLVACYLVFILAVGVARGFVEARAKVMPIPLSSELAPAGRIHSWVDGTYLESASDNAFSHPDLNWSTGRFGTVMLSELLEHPHYFPAVVGTIAIFKPLAERGQVAVIFDNEKVVQLGYDPVPLTGGAARTVSPLGRAHRNG